MLTVEEGVIVGWQEVVGLPVESVVVPYLRLVVDDPRRKLDGSELERP